MFPLRSAISFNYFACCCFLTRNFVLVLSYSTGSGFEDSRTRRREDESSSLFVCEHFRAAPVRKW